MKDEALKLALEFANDIQRGNYKGNAEEIITAIKQASSAPVQEPAFWLNEHGQLAASKGWAERTWHGQKLTPLYTTPPAAPVQPVAWLSTDSIGERYLCFDKPLDADPVQPLYAAPPAAQPAPVQEPVAWIRGSGLEMLKLENGGVATVYASEAMSNHSSPLYTTPPNVATPLAAQRQSARSAWVGLTDEAKRDMATDHFADDWAVRKALQLLDAHENKLKEKNSD